MLLYQLVRGDAPLVIDVPHGGTHVPDALVTRMAPAARTVPDTDWHVEKLYAFAGSTGATLMCATHSRYVVDLNRDPRGVALYPGADNTEICPTRTFDNEPIYASGDEPTPREIEARLATWFAPYHAALAAEVERVRGRHGHAILLDGHSIRGRVPRFFAGRLPDLNLGTAEGASCHPGARALASAILGSDERFSRVVDGRFKGGYVTRHYGRPAHGVHALQLEMVQEAYMAEDAPYRWEPGRARPLMTLLERLVVGLAEWRPPSA